MYRILTSAMGLGTYVPALFLRDYYESIGIHCEVSVVESYISEKAKEKIEASKDNYHRSFKAAKLGHRLAEKKLSNLLDTEIKEEIIRKWDANPADKIIVFSGNWMDLLCDYQKITNMNPDNIIALHMDVGKAPSWSRYSNNENWFTSIRIYGDDNVNFLIEHQLMDKKDVYHSDKNSCVYIHGGGWGMGPYQEMYECFHKEIPYKVKTTIHSLDEKPDFSEWDYYLLESKWEPWYGGELTYPKMHQIISNKKKEIENESHNGLLRIYSECCAIISKAGGGTLMDSLLTATPLIFIDPIAKHEEENQKLWIKLGLGITYEDWKSSNFSTDLLAGIYEKLLKYREDIPGIGKYLESH